MTEYHPNMLNPEYSDVTYNNPYNFYKEVSYEDSFHSTINHDDISRTNTASNSDNNAIYPTKADHMDYEPSNEGCDGYESSYSLNGHETGGVDDEFLNELFKIVSEEDVPVQEMDFASSSSYSSTMILPIQDGEDTSAEDYESIVPMTYGSRRDDAFFQSDVGNLYSKVPNPLQPTISPSTVSISSSSTEQPWIEAPYTQETSMEPYHTSSSNIYDYPSQETSMEPPYNTSSLPAPIYDNSTLISSGVSTSSMGCDSHVSTCTSSDASLVTTETLQAPIATSDGFVNAYLIVDPVSQIVYFPKQIISCQVGDHIETNEFGPFVLPSFDKNAIASYTQCVVQPYYNHQNQQEQQQLQQQQEMNTRQNEETVMSYCQPQIQPYSSYSSHENNSFTNANHSSTTTFQYQSSTTPNPLADMIQSLPMPITTRSLVSTEEEESYNDDNNNFDFEFDNNSQGPDMVCSS